MEALSAATINPAIYLAMDGRISHIMLNGRIYEAGELREEFTGDAELNDFYWEGKAESAIR